MALPKSLGKETLVLEFKSDANKGVSNEGIFDAVVGLANTDGGVLYIGVEDDGTPTGAKREHLNPIKLSALIANNTVPPIPVRVSIEGDELRIARVEVPRYTSIVSTKSGRVLRRRIKFDGTPENLPMYPYELASRLSDLGKLDFSAQPLADATVGDFDPLERERMRRIIRASQNADQTLLALSDGELDGALGLTVRPLDGSAPVPTVAGMLLLGTPEALARHVPTHEAAFQVLQGTEVRVNEDYHCSLLQTFERITEMFAPWNPQREVMRGLVSTRISDFSVNAFREALVNAFGHRDYSQLGRVRVLVDDAGLTIGNPGGFIEGIDQHNLLTADPRGRNPRLMDALKRIGLAERTGRGIDRIFEGSLAYGRPVPDYSGSTSVGVSVFIARSAPDEAFIAMVQDEEQRSGRQMSINTLLVLNHLKTNGESTVEEMRRALNITSGELQVVVGQLVESGLIEALRKHPVESYMLSSRVYTARGDAKAYVRRKAIDAARDREMVMDLARTQGHVTRADVTELLHIDGRRATALLGELRQNGLLSLTSKGRYAKYRPAEH